MRAFDSQGNILKAGDTVYNLQFPTCVTQIITISPNGTLWLKSTCGPALDPYPIFAVPMRGSRWVKKI